MKSKLFKILVKMIANILLWSCMAWFLKLVVQYGGAGKLARPLADYFDLYITVLFLIGFVMAASLAHFLSKRFSVEPFFFAVLEELGSWALNLGSFFVAAGLPAVNSVVDVNLVEGGVVLYGVFVLITLVCP